LPPPPPPLVLPMEGVAPTGRNREGKIRFRQVQIPLTSILFTRIPPVVPPKPPITDIGLVNLEPNTKTRILNPPNNTILQAIVSRLPFSAPPKFTYSVITPRPPNSFGSIVRAPIIPTTLPTPPIPPAPIAPPAIITSISPPSVIDSNAANRIAMTTHIRTSLPAVTLNPVRTQTVVYNDPARFPTPIINTTTTTDTQEDMKEGEYRSKRDQEKRKQGGRKRRKFRKTETGEREFAYKTPRSKLHTPFSNEEQRPMIVSERRARKKLLGQGSGFDEAIRNTSKGSALQRSEAFHEQRSEKMARNRRLLSRRHGNEATFSRKRKTGSGDIRTDKW